MQKSCGYKRRGFSLVEMLVVIAIITILIAAVLKVGSTVRLNAQVKNTKAAISIMVQALQAYQQDQERHHGQFEFPPGVESLGSGWGLGDVETELDNFYGGNNTVVVNDESGENLHNEFTWSDGEDVPDTDDRNARIEARASIEMLYAVLDEVTACRTILNRLPANMTSNNDQDSVSFDGGNEFKALVEVNDAWGGPLRYENRGVGNFPVITSAGADGIFDTADDLLSSEF